MTVWYGCYAVFDNGKYIHIIGGQVLTFHSPYFVNRTRRFDTAQ